MIGIQVVMKSSKGPSYPSASLTDLTPFKALSMPKRGIKGDILHH